MPRREPVDRIIKKTDHWKLADRREYLIRVLQDEKGRWRRRRLALALRDITTKVLKQERRHERS